MSEFFDLMMQNPSKYIDMKLGLDDNRALLKRYGDYTDEQLAVLDAKQSQEHLDRVVKNLPPETHKRYMREWDVRIRLETLRIRKFMLNYAKMQKPK